MYIGKTNKDYAEINWRRFYIAFTSKSMELCFQIDKPWRKFEFGWHYSNFGWPELDIKLGCFTLFFSWMRGFSGRYNDDGTLKTSE